jgi:hypothetical protein
MFLLQRVGLEIEKKEEASRSVLKAVILIIFSLLLLRCSAIKSKIIFLYNTLLSQTVSEFAAGQVLQVDDDIHQDLYRERERDRDRDAYVTASTSPSRPRVDR